MFRWKPRMPPFPLLRYVDQACLCQCLPPQLQPDSTIFKCNATMTCVMEEYLLLKLAGWNSSPFSIGNTSTQFKGVHVPAVTSCVTIALRLWPSSKVHWYHHKQPEKKHQLKKFSTPLKKELVGGFSPTPCEKYARQNGFIFPNFRDEKKQIFEVSPPTELPKTTGITSHGITETSFT